MSGYGDGFQHGLWSGSRVRVGSINGVLDGENINRFVFNRISTSKPDADPDRMRVLIL